MDFYTVIDSETGYAVGILLEGEKGGIVAQSISGSAEATDSPARVINKIMESKELRVVTRRGDEMIAETIRSGEPGYVAAIMATIRPPLIPGPRGRVKRMGSPQDMLRRVWLAIGETGDLPQEPSGLDSKYPHRSRN